jgi:hypothetical protein
MTERRWHSSVDECQRRKFPAKKPRDMLKLGSGANTGLPKYFLIFRSAVNGNLRITRLFTAEDLYGSESSTLFLNGKGDLI